MVEVGEDKLMDSTAVPDVTNDRAACHLKMDDMENSAAVMKDSDLQLPLPVTTVELRSKLADFCRKRTRDDYHAMSSDPPLFSSDDVPDSSENYLGCRNKRRYRGTWWGDKATPVVQDNVRTKRKFKRAIDSGVWMGSDDSRTDDDVELEMEASLYSPIQLEGGKSFLPTSTSTLQDSNYGQSSPHLISRAQTQNVSHGDLAQGGILAYVQHCVEAGQEEVDLSQVQNLSNAALRPLRYFIKEPPSQLPPSQENYQPLAHLLRLYLSNNDLHDLPDEVFKLTTLALLSVRQNELTEVSPAIRNLVNLEELNLGGNKLRWLPWEILLLSQHKLANIYVHPNPFVQPIPRIKYNLFSRVRSWPRRRPWAASKVAYLDISGTPCRGSPAAPSSQRQYPVSRDRTSQNTFEPWKETPNQTPSLLELALRSCSTSTTPKDLPSLLPGDSTVLDLLKQALAVKDAGGRACTICGRSFIIARTEWLEWWTFRDSLIFKGVMPFLRRGCSWMCVPDLSSLPRKRRECEYTTDSDSKDGDCDDGVDEDD